MKYKHYHSEETKRLKEQFDYIFNLAVKMREAEEKQNPFAMGTSPNGFMAIVCLN